LVSGAESGAVFSLKACRNPAAPTLFAPKIGF